MRERNEALTTVGADGLQALHHQLLRRAVTHFFPDATLKISGPAAARPQRTSAGAQHVQFACGGSHCECRRAHPFTRSERRLLDSLASVVQRRFLEFLHPPDGGSSVPGTEAHIVSATDQLVGDRTSRASGPPSKQDLHYLLAGANVLTLPTAIVQSVARIDGAVVVRPTGELIAVGAILKGVGGITGIEGARTTAAIHASHLGTAIKVSEDGGVSLFKDGARVWHL
jgi:hypothetical protein